MDQRRFILFIVFAFSLFMLWQGWNQTAQPPVAPAIEGQPTSGISDVPTASGSLRGDAPSATEIGPEATRSAAPTMTVRTDMVIAEISAQGGDIVKLALRQHKAARGSDDDFILFDDGARHFYAAQSGLLGEEGLPNHRTMFILPAAEQVMNEGQDTLTVRLQAPERDDGVSIVKVLTFHRDSYLIDVAYEIINRSDRAVQADAYFQFTRDGQPAEAIQLFGVHTFTGPAFYTDEARFQKVQFEDIDKDKAKFVKRAPDGWMAMVQHYFVGAWLPEQGVQREYFARRVGSDLYSAGLITPVPTVQPGQTQQVDVRLYAGPQQQKKLAGIADGLNLVVDYGWLTVIAAPLFVVLSWFHSLTGNWGWAIILVTIAIKLLFFPLSAASYKSMAKMRVLGPRMQRIKELYSHDKAKMQQEMMEMYRREKINPLGGCLPILVQIPVFIALYWVLLGSFEMRHAPWLGWIQDLSAKDPYFILPVIMGLSMLIQMKLNPAPPDPIQAKVMTALPIVFTFMFMWFPSGLVLYWVVNNILSIAQQWQITRMIEGGKKTGAKSA